MMIPFFLMLKYFGLLRVSEEEERLGLDISHHNGAAYPQDNLLEKVGIETQQKEVELMNENP